MNLAILINLLPIAFALHNIEEYYGMENWTKNNPFYRFEPVKTKQFLVAIFLFSMLGFVLVYSRSYYPTKEIYSTVVLGFSGMLFLNVFFPHLLATLLTKKYSPGLFTAIFINLPLCSAIIWKMGSEGSFSIQQLIFIMILGGLVGLILVFLFLRIGKLVI